MNLWLNRALLAGAALCIVGCALPGPIIVVTDPGLLAVTATAPALPLPVQDAPPVVVKDAAADAFGPSSQIDAVEAQHRTVERRVAALRQGISRVKGRQLVTGAIRDAVVNRVATLESSIAALEAEFDRRALRLDAILDRLRERQPDEPDAPDISDPPVDEPAL